MRYIKFTWLEINVKPNIGSLGISVLETTSFRDAFGLRHWANGAEKLPRAHFSENSAPVMAHCFPFGRTFWKWVRPTRPKWAHCFPKSAPVVFFLRHLANGAAQMHP